MYISGINSVSFNGLWEPVKNFRAETGILYKDKTVYTLHDFVYHPFEGESASDTISKVCEHYKGRSFSLWESRDGHHKEDHFQMNRVTVGKPVQRIDTPVYLYLGYNENFKGGILEDKEFKEAWYNDTYAPYDIRFMTPEYVEQIIDRHKNQFEAKA